MIWDHVCAPFTQPRSLFPERYRGKRERGHAYRLSPRGWGRASRLGSLAAVPRTKVCRTCGRTHPCVQQMYVPGAVRSADGCANISCSRLATTNNRVGGLACSGLMLFADALTQEDPVLCTAPSDGRELESCELLVHTLRKFQQTAASMYAVTYSDVRVHPPIICCWIGNTEPESDFRRLFVFAVKGIVAAELLRDILGGKAACLLGPSTNQNVQTFLGRSCVSSLSNLPPPKVCCGTYLAVLGTGHIKKSSGFRVSCRVPILLGALPAKCKVQRVRFPFVFRLPSLLHHSASTPMSSQIRAQRPNTTTTTTRP